jgi:pimeloyl-[acyl-carrier protein] methyl ester esterase
MATLTDKIKAIVFIASTPCFVNRAEWANVIDKENIEELKDNLLNNTENTLKYFSGLIANGDVSVKETNKIIYNNLANNNSKDVLAIWLVQMQQTDLRKEWAKINLPMKMILGERDSLINSKIERQIKTLNPSIEIEVIKNCGHAPFISKQEATIKIINAFINAKLN